jgi:hypothetical protein
MSFLGNGFECPAEGEPGLEAADSAGDTEVPRTIRWEDLGEWLELLVAGDAADKCALPAGLMVVPGGDLITPAAMPPETGINNACGGGRGSAVARCDCS